MARQFANNATTLLADGISSTATELTVTPGTGGLFPAVNQAEDGNWFDLTLEDVNGVIEIMKCTVHGAGSNTLTIGERGLEGTTPSNFNADTRVEIRLTASALNGWFQPVGGVIDGGEFGDDDATITTIKSHRSVVADEQPPGGSLSLGELAINVTDGKMWVGNQAGDPVELVSGGSGSPTGAHNDLTGRTVALCHPFVSIYNPDDDNKNLADTLNDLVEEAPLDGDAYARMNGDWAAIDLSVPAAEWGSITGNLYSQSDLMAEFSEYGKRKSSVSVSGLWTFTGWTGYNSGLKFRVGCQQQWLHLPAQLDVSGSGSVPHQRAVQCSVAADSEQHPRLAGYGVHPDARRRLGGASQRRGRRRRDNRLRHP